MNILRQKLSGETPRSHGLLKNNRTMLLMVLAGIFSVQGCVATAKSIKESPSSEPDAHDVQPKPAFEPDPEPVEECNWDIIGRMAMEDPNHEPGDFIDCGGETWQLSII